MNIHGSDVCDLLSNTKGNLSRSLGWIVSICAVLCALSPWNWYGLLGFSVMEGYRASVTGFILFLITLVLTARHGEIEKPDIRTLTRKR